jgi:hypothetical protein
LIEYPGRICQTCAVGFSHEINSIQFKRFN